MKKRIWSDAKDCYIVQDLDWIKEQIVKISGLKEDDVGRELIITPLINRYGKVGTICFSLNGTPPRGFALLDYQEDRDDHGQICFISWGYKKKKTYENTIIKKDLIKGLKYLEGKMGVKG